MSKILAAVGSGVVLSLVVASVVGAVPSAHGHVQKVALTILPGDRIDDPNLALSRGVLVRVTVTNTTREFHTFTVPALGLSRLILPADEHGARKTTFTFKSNLSGSLAWYCVICPSGEHRSPHAMSGALYMIVDPSAIP